MQVRASAPQAGPAAFDLNADSQAAVAADWTPGRGEAVRLLTMGGSSGQVLSEPDAKGKLAVKVRSHVLQLQHHSLQSSLKPIIIAAFNTKEGQVLYCQHQHAKEELSGKRGTCISQRVSSEEALLSGECCASRLWAVMPAREPVHALYRLAS